MKKFSAILLAVLLILSLSITAFAADETFTGTITVNGAENGKTYELYKIFDITTVNGNPAYSIPKDQENAYKNSTYVHDENQTVSFDGLFETTTATVDGATVTYVTRKNGTTDNMVISWAKQNTGIFGTATTQEAANGKVEFTGLDNGYYYVKSPVKTDATAMIADTSKHATVNEKNSTPGWGDEGGKTADGETYYAGETITYTLTYTNAVNYDQGKQVEKYIIEDKLPEGIIYTGNLTVTVKETMESEGTEVVPDVEDNTITNGFKVSIPWKNADGTSKYTSNPSIIVVTYTATMGNTKIAAGIVNTAKIYPNTNTDPGTETEKKDTVYTGQIVLNKIEEITNAEGQKEDKPLSGAKFKVKVGAGTDAKYLKQNGEAPNYTYEEVEEAQATEFVTGADGKITLAGLKEGTYTFIETEAPAGYQLPGTSTPAPSATLKLTKDEHGNVTATTDMSMSRRVVNSKAAAMPETGGMGTTLFYVIGAVLAVGALIMLVTQKRMRAAR